jgi:hypothetical protein
MGNIWTREKERGRERGEGEERERERKCQESGKNCTVGNFVNRILHYILLG